MPIIGRSTLYCRLPQRSGRFRVMVVIALRVAWRTRSVVIGRPPVST
jgi:hypothetical protein